jgi:hypothetical protein
MKNNLLKICIAFLGIAMTGCLDDAKYALDPSGTENIIEFADASIPSNPAGAIYPVYTNTTEIVPSITFEAPISYSGPNKNTKDIQLTLAVDEVALLAYNQQMNEEFSGQGTYQMMPSTYYSFDDFTVTIPKGQTKVNISYTVFPEEFDLTQNFALPIRIVSSSEGTLSAHWSVAILAVVVKNQYDGVYDVIDGYIIRNSGSGPDAVLGGDYVDGLRWELATINGNTCGFDPTWKEGSGIGGIGTPRLVVDAATNNVTVSSTANATLKNTPATINSYDPATKTFVLNFDWGTAPNTRIISVTLKYNKPRS